MSIFTESTWDADETGDKLSKELFKKKRTKRKLKKANPDDIHAQEDQIDIKKKKGKRNSLINANAHVETPTKKFKIFNKSKNQAQNSSNYKAGDVNKCKVISNKVKSLSLQSSPVENTDDSKKKQPSDFTFSRIQTDLTCQTKTKKKKKRQDSNIPESCTPIKEEAVKVSKLQLIQDKKRKRKRAKVSLTNTVENSIEINKKEIQSTRNKCKINIDKLQKMLIAKQQPEVSSKKHSIEPLSLRDRMMAKLRASRFRYLNEQLYSSASFDSKKFFKDDPDAFKAYHDGYKQQVEQWPLNPLDTIIASIQKMSKDYVIADFGCGEARLAASVPQKVHSFDLVALNERVKACDMAHTPVLSNGVHVVVFCLSLMGTNLTDYLMEANRILKKDGTLKIAEVESRFEGIENFIKLMADYGFVNTWKDMSHNLFYFMDFKKVRECNRKNKLPSITLKPCLYKKR